MRAGGCAVVQQALAAEAAGVVRQAVTLARRRGHVQVTPLHVASVMLSAAGLLRAACLRSHSHPLQCKALELCFNVALNRLPTAMFHGHGHGHGGAHHHQRSPALSNALVAAFKRAQAHQRRGGAAEQQQPTAVAPVLAAKVELEQLIVSILDDPSVSRVMREAGFSSPQVKANVEKAVSSSSDHAANTTVSSPSSGRHVRPPTESRARADDDGAMRVLDCMASGTKRCVVVVGEGAEWAVKAVMDRVSKAELHHPRLERLKSAQFVPLSVASFQHMAREEVEAKAGDLRALVREGRAAGKGVVLVLEDLAYAADAWATASEKRRGAHGRQQQHQRYCPVEHAIMEVSSLVSACSAAAAGGGRFWLLGFGSHPVFMRCRAGQPSLEAVWELHPIVLADGGLALSLSSSSEAAQAANQQARSRTGWPFVDGAAAGESELTACCTEAATAMGSIPSWLRPYHDPDHTRAASCDTNLQLQDLWSPMHSGSATHPTSELTLSFSPTSPAASSLSGGYTRCHNTNPMMSSNPWRQLKPRQPWPPNHGHVDYGPVASAEAHGHHPSRATANPSPESISASTNSSDGGGGAAPDRRPKYRELTAENLKILCDALENRVPRHKGVAAGVASTVLRCRSGMAGTRWREGLRGTPPSSATWLLFRGRDGDGKKAMALELAKIIFGSYADFTSMSTTDYGLAHSGSSSGGELTGKRQRSPANEHGHAQRLYEAMRENPSRVVMIDDVEQLDHDSEIDIKKVIANGRIRGCNGDEISLEDAIIVLSCEEAFDSRSRSSSPWVRQRVIGNVDGDEEDGGDVEEGASSPCFSLDLNACADDGGGVEEENLHGDAEISDVVDGVFSFRLTGDLSH